MLTYTIHTHTHTHIYIYIYMQNKDCAKVGRKEGIGFTTNKRLILRINPRAVEGMAGDDVHICR